MDEPTIHLDPERRRELVRLLANLRGERGLIPQAIIVTHDPEVEQAANQVYRVEIEAGYSRVESLGGLSLPDNIPPPGKQHIS